MNKVSIIRLSIFMLMFSLLTSCNSLESNIKLGDTQSVATTTTTIDETSQTSTTDLLIEFDGYTTHKNNDGTFNFTITQEGVKNSYYTISLMYDGRMIEYISGSGYLESAYGRFAGETEEITTNENSTGDETKATTTETTAITTSEEELKSLMGKDGKWTFKTSSEGTEYIEIKLINEYGDIVYKSQFTCIVDTHLEPHIYYTTINY